MGGGHSGEHCALILIKEAFLTLLKWRSQGTVVAQVSRDFLLQALLRVEHLRCVRSSFHG